MPGSVEPRAALSMEHRTQRASPLYICKKTRLFSWQANKGAVCSSLAALSNIGLPCPAGGADRGQTALPRPPPIFRTGPWQLLQILCTVRPDPLCLHSPSWHLDGEGRPGNYSSSSGGPDSRTAVRVRVAVFRLRDPAAAAAKRKVSCRQIHHRRHSPVDSFLSAALLPSSGVASWAGRQQEEAGEELVAAAAVSARQHHQDTVQCSTLGTCRVLHPQLQPVTSLLSSPV